MWTPLVEERKLLEIPERTRNARNPRIAGSDQLALPTLIGEWLSLSARGRMCRKESC